ncbi:PRKR-interacting protein 1 homolog [Acipenser ruthenus]|uniref:PRKR-interacting protein 1 homolog n=1 Tax=Acipenser ruthenus TaxID=7906 RepID=UPI002741FB57|nr:PRKR-interacting protein 1 homolog [Acipenser ruthenus]XP_034771847.2 PRKR-interacting protein 1 homolog [Acipenser ruthenus]
MCECKRGPRRGRKMAATRESNTRPGKPAGKEPQPLVIAKTAAEEQRLKLERLMRNPDKPVTIPERPKEWNPRAPPEFVRDVMGSSAGAGSGEFHVYRHLRRREYQRQECMDTMSEKQKMDKEYQEKLQKNNQATAEKTAKRRKKRQKLKEKKLMAQKAKLEEGKDGDGDSGSNSASSSDKVPRKEGDDDAEEPSFVMGGR